MSGREIFDRSPLWKAARMARSFREFPSALDHLIGELKYIASSKRDLGREFWAIKSHLRDLEELRDLIVAEKATRRKNTGS